MKFWRVLTHVVMACVSVVAYENVFAQVPSWMEQEMRSLEYPQSEYYTAVVGDRIAANESESVALQRCKKEAMAEVASSVKVRVQNSTSSLMESLQRQCGTQSAELITNEFKSTTNTSTDMELPGLKTETWTNRATNEVYAFAYVRKRDVIRYFDKQIIINITKLEGLLQNVDQLISYGQKMQALQTSKEGVKLLANIDNSQKMLVAVDPDVSESSLQTNETRELATALIGKISSLMQSVIVFVDSREECFGRYVDVLKTMLQKSLSSDCSFVDSEADCDYKIILKGVSREGYADQYIKFGFVDVDVSIYDKSKGRTIYSDRLTAKAGNTSWDLAGKEAYTAVAKKVYDAIKPFIK